MMRWCLPVRFLMAVMGVAVVAGQVRAQPLGEADRESPGDAMIQAYLGREAEKLSAQMAEDVGSLEAWQAARPQRVEEYYYMLGLSPRPEKTPLEATVTGTCEGDGYAVDMLHYQSRPRLYVTGNLYRPAEVKKGEKLPAVFYVCGHSGRGRNGNKVAFQSHGIWFARHGYICLVVDTLQLGEIAAKHHGTYNLGRWWWHSRGYTPAGVEAWNGVRGIDYLVSRGDVDPERIAVTGISGGGAATFWIAAADERVKVAMPVSGMADLESYVTNRVINGHCDCMFLYNTFRWPWTRIAGLVAPRPLLFVNSDDDAIFPMDANERIINRLERLYSLHEASDRVDAVVSVGGHAYRRDIRQAVYRFINAHLVDDPREVADSEVDVVSEGGNPGAYPIEPEKLRVFPADEDLPGDELNTTIDEHFVPMAQAAMAKMGGHEAWKRPLVDELRRVSYGYFPDSIPAAEEMAETDDGSRRMRTEEGIEIRLRDADVQGGGQGLLLAVLGQDEAGTTPEWLSEVAQDYRTVVLCEPRGIGPTRWTTKNPPNYVERCHVLLGRTVDAGRVWDVIAAAHYVAADAQKRTDGPQGPIHVAGRGGSGLIAAYAAVLSDSIGGVTLVSPPASHMQAEAPALLNVLRVCDVPDALGMIAPRPLRVIGAPASAFERTVAAYEAAEAPGRLEFRETVSTERK